MTWKRGKTVVRDVLVIGHLEHVSGAAASGLHPRIRLCRQGSQARQTLRS